MRIIANDVTPEMGSEGSNPSLSVQARISNAGFFVAQRSAGKVASNFCCGFSDVLLPCTSLRSRLIIMLPVTL
jgi:hypothetical protein